MPRLSVWMIRAALLHFGIGVTLGALLLWNKGSLLTGDIWLVLPAHLELVLFGWIVQLASGVAFWIMPRFTGAQRFGRIKLAWAAFALLNAGILLAAAGTFGSAALIAVGRLLEALSAILFVIHIFPRVKPVSTAVQRQELI